MKKNFTPVSSTLHQTFKAAVSSDMNPSKETLRNIMRFAAAYRVEKSSNDEYVEYLLN